MPSDEYKTAIGGGLKLKGSKPAGVNKSKKKKKSKEKTGDIDSAKLQNALAEEDRKAGEDGEGDTASGKQAAIEDEEDIDDGKTPAQRRHEEMRRKRLDERLEREGVKSHKEKVEELNKYLSKLSEHHDMPRIGPG